VHPKKTEIYPKTWVFLNFHEFPNFPLVHLTFPKSFAFDDQKINNVVISMLPVSCAVPG